jgi:carbohydrate binding protein with CBM5/12 domain/glycosyl hydrolase family 18 (putative chitinase)
MPRPSRLFSCTAAALLATGLTGAGLLMTGLGPHTGLTASLTADAASSWPAHVFAPFVDTGLSNTTLTTVASDYGTKYFELAFANGAGCQWSLPNQSGWQSQISALQAEGGDVSISFGGYTVDSDGTDLGNQCSSASAMATQVESVVTTMNVTHLDFDIESNEETNTTDVTRTAQALAQVRSWASSTGRTLNISYTLPVLPSGFTSDGMNVLSAAQSNGFKPDIVNIMTMDYGSSGTEMGSAANQALDAAAGQVASVFGVSTSAAYGMLGNTPMIGQNDSPGEIFSQADAATVESHAAAEGIALLSFWSEGRDNGGCPGQTSASSTCSGLSQNSGAFTQAFQAFTSGGSSGGGGGTTPPPTSPPPTSPPPGNGSCDAAWSSSTAYTGGNEVSYNGHNWTAKWWNYDEVPGGASGVWADDGAC